MAGIRWEQIQNLLVSETEINLLAGLTATAAEINAITGFTGTTADLNALIGLDVTVSSHLADDFATAHPIAANSLDGLIIVDSTITEAKLAFSVATDTELAGIQTQVNDIVSDNAVQQSQIDNLTSIVIPGQGADLADAIQQVIDHIELVEDAHDSSAISYGNYYTLPSDITGGVTAVLTLPLSIVKHFRVGESIRFQDDITPSEDVVLSAVDYNTGGISFAIPTSSFATANNGIIWTLAEDNVKEGLDRSLRNNTDTFSGRLTIDQAELINRALEVSKSAGTTDAVFLEHSNGGNVLSLQQTGTATGVELLFSRGTLDSTEGYDLNLAATKTFVIDDASDNELFKVDTSGDAFVTQALFREVGTAFHGTLTKETLSADRTWTIKDRDAWVGLPVPSGDALKVLRVNAGETDVEWHDIVAADIDFDNTATGLAATNVQDAIDEHVTDTSIHFDTIDGLADVDTTTIPPSSDDTLIWDGANWIPSAPVRSSLIQATFHDPLSTSLPTGTSATIDNVVAVDGDRVLFSNLSSGNNKLYELSGVGVSLVWTPLEAFANVEDPTASDTVIVEKGDGFALRIGTFTGSTWTFNDTVRYFNGADYWEVTNIMSATILDSNTDNVFSTNAVGSENMIVDYSISRGSAKETGTVVITHDNTVANSAVTSSSTSSVGVALVADLLAGQVRLRYTSDNSGSNGVIKFTIKRWSDTAGGPGGVPVYSGAGSGSAGGNPGEVQYHGAGGALEGDSSFRWEDSTNNLNLNGLNIGALSGSTALNDNTTVMTPLATRDASTHRHMVVEYSIERDKLALGDSLIVRTGRLVIATNGTVGPTGVGYSDDFAETEDTGIMLYVNVVSGPLVEIGYTSSSSGFNGIFKYSIRYWN